MSTREGRVRVALGAFLAVAVVVGGVALIGAIGSGTEDSASATGDCQFGVTAADTSKYDELPPPPTGGLVPAADVLGNVRGRMNLSVLFASPTKIPSDEKPGTFDVPVVDDEGIITGYWVPDYGGFVDVETARDPKLLAQLIADPSLVVDSDGKLISGEELERRRHEGTACVR
jgi:hypothetical protein